ncbi:hypothetical protein L517_3085, partial [Bordetella bronchiseptica MBORD670]
AGLGALIAMLLTALFNRGARRDPARDWVDRMKPGHT